MLYRNLMLTMIIGGLWHGAAWTFVLWGTYQGMILVGHRLAEPCWTDPARPTPVDRGLLEGGADHRDVPPGLLRLADLPGRARSSRSSGCSRAIVYRPAIPASAYLLPVAIAILPLLLVQVVQYLSKDLDIILRTPWYVRSVFYTACFYAFVLGGEFGGGQFIYFQF